MMQKSEEKSCDSESNTCVTHTRTVGKDGCEYVLGICEYIHKNKSGKSKTARRNAEEKIQCEYVEDVKRNKRAEREENRLRAAILSGARSPVAFGFPYLLPSASPNGCFREFFALQARFSQYSVCRLAMCVRKNSLFVQHHLLCLTHVARKRLLKTIRSLYRPRNGAGSGRNEQKGKKSDQRSVLSALFEQNSDNILMFPIGSFMFRPILIAHTFLVA